jgi:very-short-patch-repair endonuclease
VSKASHGERSLLTQMQWSGIPKPEVEYRFHPTRMWRFDFCWPTLRIAVEVEGGTFARVKADGTATKGRHTTGQGFERDVEKYNAAAIKGWLVLRVTTKMVDDGRALIVITEAHAAVTAARARLARQPAPA